MAPLWQNMMIAMARSSSLTGVVQGNPRIASAANHFVGGLDEDSAIRTALSLRQRGIRAFTGIDDLKLRVPAIPADA